MSTGGEGSLEVPVDRGWLRLRDAGVLVLVGGGLGLGAALAGLAVGDRAGPIAGTAFGLGLCALVTLLLARMLAGGRYRLGAQALRAVEPHRTLEVPWVAITGLGREERNRVNHATFQQLVRGIQILRVELPGDRAVRLPISHLVQPEAFVAFVERLRSAPDRAALDRTAVLAAARDAGLTLCPAARGEGLLGRAALVVLPAFLLVTALSHRSTGPRVRDAGGRIAGARDLLETGSAEPARALLDDVLAAPELSAGQRCAAEHLRIRALHAAGHATEALAACAVYFRPERGCPEPTEAPRSAPACQAWAH